MCLSLFAFRHHPNFDLILIHNRDEFLSRPTEPAHFWNDHPTVLAGRDARDGGTWLGVTRSGRWAALTNIRNPSARKEAAPSRGHLVREYLVSEENPAAFLMRLEDRKPAYNGFNLLVGNREELHWLSTHTSAKRLAPGLYGISNGLLDSPWPKVRIGKQGFARALAEKDFTEPLFNLMRGTTPARFTELPDTGAGRDTERLLSPLFVQAPGYGTRTTTLMTWDKSGQTAFIERTYEGSPLSFRETRFSLIISIV
jgi:uncharacterized protein with NRDE domain